MLFPTNDFETSAQTDKFSILKLIIFSCAIFLPFIGHGFIHDDFSHLYSVVYEPLIDGLTKANGGPFYTPVSWLSFKLNWLLFGENAFCFALFNLVLHSVNLTLLYFFARKLWNSSVAAWWTACGFALLYPANVWAMMWISTRAHILSATFYLAAMLTALWFTRTEKSKFPPLILIIVFAALSLFSKESGITAVASILILIIYEKFSKNCQGGILLPLIVLLVGLLIVFACYLTLRSQSGAVSINIGGDRWYSYAPSPKVFFENIARYGWRTYGLLFLIAASVAAPFLIKRRKLNLGLLTKKELLLSLSLFLAMISPFVLLIARSGIYTYLPGIGASLLLGAFARSIFQPTEENRKFSTFLQIPALIVILILIGFTIGQTFKWVRMAETNMSVIAQIAEQQPQIAPGTLIILEYANLDAENGFPDGFATWSFDLALRLKYHQPDLKAALVGQQNDSLPPDAANQVKFVYTVENGKPKIIKQP